ncbi:rab-like protein 2A [Pimephales promelas]|nr:rab-like protein 2A [Pimephales promelas]
MDAGGISDLDLEKYDADEQVKIICLGDSAVGKSKLMERFLMDGYRPQQLSTYALTLYKYTATINGQTILVDFWDTAGQERFRSMHPSYYHKSHACIMVRGHKILLVLLIYILLRYLLKGSLFQL